MRIAMVAAGAGSVYCGACARDANLARALIADGHDVAVFPIYTPLRLDQNLPDGVRPLRIGGINAFLRSRFPSLAGAPPMLMRWLDSPAVVTWASQFAVRTQAADLGSITVSFLKGAAGPHAIAIRELATDVAAFRPEIVLLANSMLGGLIDPIRLAAKIPVVCQVQGEDGFLDELAEPWREEAGALLRDGVKAAAGFMAPCQAHADEMAERLGVAVNRFCVVSPAVTPFSGALHGHGRTGIRLGHLSSIRHAKGLDLLIAALDELKSMGLKCAVRGKALEPAYLAQLKLRSSAAGIDVNFGTEVAPSDKPAFIAGCDFIVLPSRLRESRGIAALEALALGVPVIAPARGIFPELAQETNGVALYSQDQDLADAIRACIAERAIWRQRGIGAAHRVAERYSMNGSASAALHCFEAVLSSTNC